MAQHLYATAASLLMLVDVASAVDAYTTVDVLRKQIAGAPTASSLVFHL